VLFILQISTENQSNKIQDMNIKDRISYLAHTGQILRQQNNAENEVYHRAKANNQWFTLDFIQLAVDSICAEFLAADKLTTWISQYEIKALETRKTLGIVMAGNIPLVGLHDFICGYLLGFDLQLKLSTKDRVLMIYFLEILSQFDVRLTEKIKVVETLQQLDAVIATGSNNTNRYFEYYFRDIPSILRKNRNSVAILNGQETAEDLVRLGDDIFMFFGLGCRNVSILYVPQDYDLTILFPYFEKYTFLFQHSKYMNNYDYNRTLLLMNGVPHLANDFCIIKEDSSIASRIAEVHVNYYTDLTNLQKELQTAADEIQCIVSTVKLNELDVLNFGDSQTPTLADYADKVDTIAFLTAL
jgi:Acyl-CoA reductase (LuxC)